MCFYINSRSKNEKTLWQATEDIVCYKRVRRRNRRIYGYYQSDFRYITNKVLTAPLLIPKNGNVLKLEDFKSSWHSWEIYEGFHSLKDNNNVYTDLNWREPVKAQFIIPKGAFFYENEKEYVSNKIILIKTLKS